MMYKVELKFDDRVLSQSDIEKLYEETDKIFAKEDLSREDGWANKRVYLDRGRKQDYGRFWAAIFALKNSTKKSKHLQECFWYNGKEKENLITDFIRG